MKMKILSLFCAILLLCTGILFGEGQQEKGEALSPDQPFTLEIWTFGSFFSDVYDELVPDYQEQYPNAKIDAKVIPYDQMHDKLFSSLISGVGIPDMVDIEINQVSRFFEFGSAGKLVALNDWLEEGGYLDDLSKGRVAPYTYDGKILGVEHGLVPVVMYYRKDLMDKYGINTDSLVTWDDVYQQGKALYEKEGISLLALRDGSTVQGIHDFWMLIQQAGGGFYDKDGNVILDNQVGIKVMEWYKKMVDSGAAYINSGAAGTPQYWAPFKANDVIACIGADWVGGNLKNNAQDQSGLWRIKPMPAWEKGGPRSSSDGGTTLAITDACENKQAAWDFLKLVQLTEKGKVTEYKINNLLPPYLPAFDNPVFESKDPFFGGQAIGKVYKEVADEQPEFYLAPSWNEAYPLFVKTVIYPVVRENKNPETALKEAAEAIRALD